MMWLLENKKNNPIFDFMVMLIKRIGEKNGKDYWY
jgi:hypothetical protein